MNTDKTITEEQGIAFNRPVISCKKLRVGMVIVPKPEHFERLSKCLLKTEYTVTQNDIDNGGEVGDLWMVKQ